MEIADQTKALLLITISALLLVTAIFPIRIRTRLLLEAILIGILVMSSIVYVSVESALQGEMDILMGALVKIVGPVFVLTGTVFFYTTKWRLLSQEVEKRNWLFGSIFLVTGMILTMLTYSHSKEILASSGVVLMFIGVIAFMTVGGIGVAPTALSLKILEKRLLMGTIFCVPGAILIGLYLLWI